MSSPSRTNTDGKAVTEQQTFSRTTSVANLIKADVSIIWTLLTNAADYARWNSTIVSIEGEIQLGGKIKLKSTLDPSRTFRLKIIAMQPEEKMVWGDAMGKRTYTLQPVEGGTIFSMVEKIGGVMFPLFASRIPAFDNAFEQFVADLKREAESVNQPK